MPRTDDHSFKLTWKVEDFNLWAGQNNRNDEWPCTPVLPIETLWNTEWQFRLFQNTNARYVACSLERCSNTDVQDVVDVHYTFHTLVWDGSLSLQGTGTISKIKPGNKRLVEIMDTTGMNFASSSSKLFSVVCTLRQPEPTEPVDLFRGKWPDQLQIFSDDMRKLFETGYLSDLKLATDDGRRIAIHSFVLIARWRKLCESLSGDGFSPRIAVHGVSGSVLYAFLSYLYTGTLPGSDVTAELFEFAVEHAPSMRELFHSLSSDVHMRTHQRKEHLTFTWYADGLKDDSIPLFRVLPLHQVNGEELIVAFDKSKDMFENLYIAVSFSLSNLPGECFLTFTCNAKYIIGDDCVKSLQHWHIFETNETWILPSLFSMDLLTSNTSDRPTCPRIEFHIVISDTPRQSVVENWVTEFRTGSRSIQKVELLTSEMRQLFMEDEHNLYDVILTTEGGSFFSSKAVLSVRSRTFLSIFKNRRKGKFRVSFTETDSVAFARVLEYVYTGWTKLSTLEEVLKVIEIAKLFSLLGLVEKCQLFIDLHTSRPLDS